MLWTGMLSYSALHGCDMPPRCIRTIRGSRQRGVLTREQCVELAPRTDDHSGPPRWVSIPYILPYMAHGQMSDRKRQAIHSPNV